MNFTKILVFLFAFTTAGLTTSVSAATVLSFYGPGYIAQGKEWILTPEGGYFIRADENRGFQNPRHQLGFYFSSGELRISWDLDFSARGEADLMPGMYLGATRYGWDNTPKLDLHGDGRGSNQVLGQFTILEMSWNEDNSPATMAVDFIHFSEGQSTNWTMGSFRYNSDIPLSQVPEPGTVTLLLLPLLGLTRRRR